MSRAACLTIEAKPEIRFWPSLFSASLRWNNRDLMGLSRRGLEQPINPHNDRLKGPRALIVLLIEQFVTAPRGNNRRLLAMPLHEMVRTGPKFMLANQVGFTLKLSN
jgi:hypothetical protein